MKKENQNSVVLLTYDEERLKETLHSIINDSFNTIIKDNLSVKKDDVEYLTIPAAAKFLNKTVRTLYNWIEQGLLKRYYIGDSPYIKKSELLNLPTNKKE